MPELNWIGKSHVVNHAEEVPFRLLRKKAGSSEGTADSGNMILHGDNLEALKRLLPYYQGRVKLVFIDPPYNTGNEGWSHDDKMNAPRLKKWFGRVVGGEGEDLSRHDKWLCTMCPRLELLRDLLAKDGSLWMTVDDNEAHCAKVLMDEILGRTNFIAFPRSGKTVVLEWKGSNLVTNEETLYKEALGDDWAALDPENRYFRIVGDSDVHEILREVATL